MTSQTTDPALSPYDLPQSNLPPAQLAHLGQQALRDGATVARIYFSQAWAAALTALAEQGQVFIEQARAAITAVVAAPTPYTRADVEAWLVREAHCFQNELTEAAWAGLEVFNTLYDTASSAETYAPTLIYGQQWLRDGHQRVGVHVQAQARTIQAKRARVQQVFESVAHRVQAWPQDWQRLGVRLAGQAQTVALSLWAVLPRTRQASARQARPVAPSRPSRPSQKPAVLPSKFRLTKPLQVFALARQLSLSWAAVPMRPSLPRFSVPTWCPPARHPRPNVYRGGGGRWLSIKRYMGQLRLSFTSGVARAHTQALTHVYQLTQTSARKAQEALAFSRRLWRVWHGWGTAHWVSALVLVNVLASVGLVSLVGFAIVATNTDYIVNRMAVASHSVTLPWAVGTPKALLAGWAGEAHMPLPQPLFYSTPTPMAMPVVETANTAVADLPSTNNVAGDTLAIAFTSGADSTATQSEAAALAPTEVPAPLPGEVSEWAGVVAGEPGWDGAYNCSGAVVAPAGSGSFVWPADNHWVSGYDFSWWHMGLDMAGVLGDPIYAADAGAVVYAGWNDWGYGNMVVIDHGNGWHTLYAHLSDMNVTCGQGIEQSALIGWFGSTGNSTGPHLHFEMRNNLQGRVNPWNYLP